MIISNGHRIIKIWEAQSGREIRQVKGHPGWVTRCCFSPDNQTIASVGDKHLILWNVDTGAQRAECWFEGIISVAWRPDARFLAVGRANGLMHILKIENHKPGIPVLTAMQMEQIACGCPFCRVWSEVSERDLGKDILCPHCRQPLKLNPFPIRADWRRVASGWSSGRPHRTLQ